MDEEVINYLNRVLTQREDSRFRRLGPHSLICESDTDTIVVFVNRDNLVIMHDGADVVHSLTLIPHLPVATDDEGMNHYYLQPILAKF